MVGGGLPGRGFYEFGSLLCEALRVRLHNRFPGYFGGGEKVEDPEKVVLLETQIREQGEFWMGVLTSISSKTATSITELLMMDVFDLFALLGVVEKQNQPKGQPEIPKHGQYKRPN